MSGFDRLLPFALAFALPALDSAFSIFSGSSGSTVAGNTSTGSNRLFSSDVVASLISAGGNFASTMLEIESAEDSRAWQSGENDTSRVWDSEQRELDRLWRAEQAEIERGFRREMFEAEAGFKAGEAAKARKFEAQIEKGRLATTLLGRSMDTRQQQPSSVSELFGNIQASIKNRG